MIDEKVNWQSKNELVFGTTVSTKSLDPANGYSGWFTVRYGVSETLFKLNDNMEVIPWLAKEYNQIDNNTWEIKIKENIKFQNDKTLTPQAVKLSIERTLKLNARALDTLKIKKITTTKDSIIITTSEENPTLINDLCDPFVSIIDVYEKDNDNCPVGTGPFKVDKFRASGTSYFVKNENYWDSSVKLSSIKVIPIGDSDTLAMALQSGEIDVAQGLSYSMVNLFEKDKNYKISTTDTSRAVVLYFNEENEALKNSKVRKAINMLIDKNSYCSLILKNQATPGIGAFPTNNAYALDKINTTFNKEEALKLLKEAGYADKKLTLKLVTYSSRAELPSIAQVIQNDLKNAGINVKIEIGDNIEDILSSGDFDLAIYSNINSSTGDALAYLNNAFYTNGASNYGKYSNKEVDKLINQLKVEFNKDKRDKLAVEIQKIALNEDAYNYIGYMKMSFVMKNNVEGINPHPTDYYQFNANTNIK